jgi:hypothetical protein
VAYSCNGFHEASTGQKYNGIGYLWKDMLQQHAQKRYHVMVSGGDSQGWAGGGQDGGRGSV